MNDKVLMTTLFYGLLVSSRVENAFCKSEIELRKSYYEPIKKRDTDKNGNPIKRNSKGKRKSKNRKH